MDTGLGLGVHGSGSRVYRVQGIGYSVSRSRVQALGFTLMSTCLAAFTMPLAMTSHFMMPPKILTRSALTWGISIQGFGLLRFFFV